MVYYDDIIHNNDNNNKNIILLLLIIIITNNNITNNIAIRPVRSLHSFIFNGVIILYCQFHRKCVSFSLSFSFYMITNHFSL